jgi:hypothetical protein
MVNGRIIMAGKFDCFKNYKQERNRETMQLDPVINGKTEQAMKHTNMNRLSR